MEQLTACFYHDTGLKKVAWMGNIELAPVDFGDRYIAAFTVAELGEMLPSEINSGEWCGPLSAPLKGDNDWWFYELPVLSSPKVISLGGTPTDRNEADARAKMLVYLIENNLVTPDLV